jgi:3-hydroxyacyl-[acyl-carrier-protein] dehydratase
MPGVLLIEAMAQTAGWLVIAVTRFTRMPFLVGVKEAKLRTFIKPGETLSISAELVHEGSGYAVTKARIVTDKPICDAEIRFKVLDFPNEEFRARMDEWATRLQFPREALNA